MAVNLRQVFSQETYNDLNKYMVSGKDAISMLGYDNEEVFLPIDIVTRFQTLADPEFIQETRTNWGDINSSNPYQKMKNVPTYIGNTYNSFSLKSRLLEGGKLRFPLVGSYKNINKNYFGNDDCKNFDTIKNIFETSFNIKIVDAKKPKKHLEYKGGKVRFCGELISSFVKTTHKFFRAQNLDESLKLSPTKLGFGKAKISMASAFRGQNIPEAEKVVALVNYWSGKTIFQVAKRQKKFIKQFKPKNFKQIAYVSQILTDMFVCQALGLGVQTNKKIDNALKLQLSNQIALANLTPNDLKLASRMAEVSTKALLRKLKLPSANIIKNRQAMGTFYREKPETFYDVLFGETHKKDFAKIGNDIVYNGNSNFLNQFSKNEEEQILNFVPNKKSEPANNNLFEANNLFEDTLTQEVSNEMPDQNFNDVLGEEAAKNEDLLEETQNKQEESSTAEEDRFMDELLFEPSNKNEQVNIMEPTIEPLRATNSNTEIKRAEEENNTNEQEVEEDEKTTNPEDYLDLTNEILKLYDPKSYYLDIRKEIEKAENPKSFYYDLTEEINQKDKQTSIAKKPVTQSSPIQNEETFEKYEKKSYKRQITKDQKTLADFVAKAEPKHYEKINIVSPTAQKSEPNIIYIQPLELGKIKQPLPQKAILKSNKITYKQAEAAFDKIVDSIIGNTLRENTHNTSSTKTVKFEENTNEQISNLTVNQMKELVFILEKFKKGKLDFIFDGEDSITKEKCGVKSASALINKEPKSRHTLLKTDIKKIILEYVKQVQEQEIRQFSWQKTNQNQSGIQKTKKPFSMEDNLECYVDTKNLPKLTASNQKAKTEIQSTKFAVKKQLSAQSDLKLLPGQNNLKLLPAQSDLKKQESNCIMKQRPTSIVREIRCTRCPLGIKFNPKRAKAKASNKNLE